MHPNKAEVLVISKKRYRTGKTTEEDCIDMNWSTNCPICNRTFPGRSSLPGHYRHCKEDRPYPNGSRNCIIADKLVKEEKMEQLLNEKLPVIEFNGSQVRNKYKVKYLGSIITANGCIKNEIRSRATKASTTFRQFHPLFSNTKLSILIKLRFYDALVMSIALYGCESWPFLSKHLRIISRMTTGDKMIIRNATDANYKSLYDAENDHILHIVHKWKIKYLYDILNQRGCRKMSELLDKHRNNPFFEFINNNNYIQHQTDALQLPLSKFLCKYPVSE